jgi:hypothetical protein
MEKDQEIQYLQGYVAEYESVIEELRSSLSITTNQLQSVLEQKNALLKEIEVLQNKLQLYNQQMQMDK